MEFPVQFQRAPSPPTMHQLQSAMTPLKAGSPDDPPLFKQGATVKPPAPAAGPVVKKKFKPHPFFGE